MTWHAMASHPPGLVPKALLDPPYIPFPMLFNLEGFTPLPPMVDMLERNVKGRKESPANPITSYGPGVVTLSDLFRGPPATSTIITIEFQKREKS